MKCTVGGCKQDSRKKSPGKIMHWFRFPSKPEQLKHWIDFCKTSKPINKYDRICSLHFKNEDFERNFKFELGIIKHNKFKLKPDAVPSVIQPYKMESLPQLCKDEDPVIIEHRDGCRDIGNKSPNPQIAQIKMSGRLINLKYPIIIVNAERTSRKTYITHAYLVEAIDKANKFGCPGSIMLNDEDGSEICDDEIFEYLLQRKAKFMICNKCSDWTPQNVLVTSAEEEKDQTQIVKVSNHCSGESSPSTHQQLELPETVPFQTTSTATPRDIVRNLTYPEFANFSLPWEKVSPFIMHLLETEQPLHRNVNAVANLFIDELLLIKPTLPIPIMRRVAEQAVSRYPASFSWNGIDKNTSEDIHKFLSVLKYRYFGLKDGKVKRKRPQIKLADEDNTDFSVLPDIDIDVKVEFDSLSSDE